MRSGERGRGRFNGFRFCAFPLRSSMMYVAGRDIQYIDRVVSVCDFQVNERCSCCRATTDVKQAMSGSGSAPNFFIATTPSPFTSRPATRGMAFIAPITSKDPMIHSFACIAAVPHAAIEPLG